MNGKKRPGHETVQKAEHKLKRKKNGAYNTTEKDLKQIQALNGPTTFFSLIMLH